MSANVTLVEGTTTPTVQTVTTTGENVTTTVAEPADETTTEPAPAETPTTTTEATTVTAEAGVTTTETTAATTTTVEAATTTVTPTAETTEAEPVRTANVSFMDQDTRGTNLTVQSVALPEGGFIVIHNGGIVEGQVVESIVGQSDYLAPGMHRNVTITLADPLNESQRLFAVVYRDSNDNREFDFVESNRTADGPYTKVDSPEAVNAVAIVEVVHDNQSATVTTTENETA